MKLPFHLHRLTVEESRILKLLRQPDRYQPDAPITAAEAGAWREIIGSKLGAKVDLAMINLAQQQAQMAVHATADDVVRLAGYAAGFRAAWVVAKSISTITGTDAGQSETVAPTDAPGLAHLHP